MRIAGVCVNERGETIARFFEKELQNNGPNEKHTVSIFRNKDGGKLGALSAELFNTYEGIIFFCAVGIAVRMIAPLIKNKYEDPAVVVVDNGCRNAISLLSGHEGGANRLSQLVAGSIAAIPIITTATEAQKDLVIGLGARRGVSKEQVCGAIKNALTSAGLSWHKVRIAATIGRKYYEPGLWSALQELHIPLVRITENRILTFAGAFTAGAASRHIGIPAVAEPCALLASREGELIVPLWKEQGVTVAVVQESIKPIPIMEQIDDEEIYAT